jgi:hypothetical protein
MRMPWFVGLTDAGAFARLETTNRLRAGSRQASGPRFGPFRTREDAQFYEEQVLSLHQLRRCTETLAPSPEHPGCIYGEMNQCLRPCQTAVSAEEYATESARVAEFLFTSGKSALQTLFAARDRAAANLDFEQAALAHKRIEKVQAARAARDGVITALDNFNGLAVTKASEPECVNLWPICGAYWQPAIHLHLPHHQQLPVSRSLDAMLRERLESALALPSVSGNQLEHLAIFARWYYSSWRDGHWFAFESLKQLNYRRLVKAISGILKAAVT